MLGEVVRNRPEIALDDFLPIFLSSSLVLVFGAFGYFKLTVCILWLQDFK